MHRQSLDGFAKRSAEKGAAAIALGEPLGYKDLVALTLALAGVRLA